MRLSTLGVFGNLDDEPYMDRFGIEDVHLRRIELDRGPSVCGFETYRRSCGKVATS